MQELLGIFKKKTLALPDRFEICISGSGGQGIILAGAVLAYAVAVCEGRNAIQTQSYGPESRGGASRCEVVISDGEIFYPKTTEVDLLLALTQEALDKNLNRLKKGGVLILDSFMIKEAPKGIRNCYRLAFTQIAREKFGNPLVANIIALGFFAAVAKVAGLDALRQSLKQKVKEKYLELNERALAFGFEEGQKRTK